MQEKGLRALSLSERIDVRSFIEVSSDKLRRIALGLKRRDPLASVRSVYSFNSRSIGYPFTVDGKPSHGYRVEVFPWLRFGSLFTVYLRNWEGDYAWLKPSMVVDIGYGICVDTSNLCTTLLRIMGVEASTVIGVVKPRGSDRFYGHAWTKTFVGGEQYLLETTIHDKRKSPSPIPSRDLDKLQLEYVEAASFDERKIEFDEDVWRRYDLTLSRIAKPEAML
jgi:hypothetical protein